MYWNSWDNDNHKNAFRFLEEIEQGLSDDEKESYLEDPHQTFNISFDTFSKLINLIGEIKEEFEDKLRSHESDYYHNSKGYY